MVTRTHVESWLQELKKAWESGRPDEALKLFAHTDAYYERPFRAGRSAAEIAKYWRDIEGLTDIKFTFDVVAIEEDIACIHWENWFRSNPGSNLVHLDGVFIVTFDPHGHCRTFRQWWFMETE